MLYIITYSQAFGECVTSCSLKILHCFCQSPNFRYLKRKCKGLYICFFFYLKEPSTVYMHSKNTSQVKRYNNGKTYAWCTKALLATKNQGSPRLSRCVKNLQHFPCSTSGWLFQKSYYQKKKDSDVSHHHLDTFVAKRHQQKLKKTVPNLQAQTNASVAQGFRKASSPLHVKIRTTPSHINTREPSWH